MNRLPLHTLNPERNPASTCIMHHAITSLCVCAVPWQVRVDGLHSEIEQGRLSQQQLKAHYVKRIEDLHTQTEAYRLVCHFTNWLLYAFTLYHIRSKEALERFLI